MRVPRSDEALGLEIDERGLCLRALGLWLDPSSAAPAAFASHAHASSAFASGQLLASPETIALAQGLGLGPKGAAEIGWSSKLDWPIGREFGGGSARLSIAPAGHLLGAAQLVVDHPRGRLVYTGDWSSEVDATHAAGEAVACDELIVTSPFALPIFRFESFGTTLDRLVGWCAERLEAAEAPVVVAQTPGGAQSVAVALAARGLRHAATEEVRRACAAYEKLGVPAGSCSVDRSAGAVFLAHAGARGEEVRSGPHACVAYASPWALLDSAVEQKRADAAFVLADVADHDGLRTLVRRTGATVVHVTRGDAREFAHMLGAEGFDADAFELPAIDERGAS